MLIQIKPSQIHEHVKDIALIIITHVTIYHITIRVIDIFFVQPLVHILHQVFQIPNPVNTCFNGVITQIFRQGSRIEHRQRVRFRVKTIHRISHLFRDPLFYHLLFVFKCLYVKHGLICHFHGMIVCHPQSFRNQDNIFVSRLSHIIIAHVIHDRRGYTVFPGKRSRTQGIGRVSMRCRQVMSETQNMSYFMYNHPLQTFSIFLQRQFHRADGLIT